VDDKVNIALGKKKHRENSKKTRWKYHWGC